MSTCCEQLEKGIAAILKQHGFTRRKKNWYLRQSQIVFVLNLQKSQWGEQFYVNFGANLEQLSASQFPSAINCHIYGRARQLAFPDKEDLILSCEDEADVSANLERFSELLESEVMPTIQSLVATEGVREFVASRVGAHLLIRGELRQWLAEQSYLLSNSISID